MEKASYDFDTIRNDIISKFGEAFPSQSNEQTQFNYNSVVVRLAEIFAERLSSMGGYASYLFRECKWKTSQNNSSVLSQLDFFGYKPHRLIGCNGYVKVTAPNMTVGSETISIPKWTKFSDGVNSYYSTEYVTIYQNNYANVPVVQGELNSIEFSGDDMDTNHPDSKFILENNIDSYAYELLKNGQSMREVDYWGQTDSSKFGSSYILRNKEDFSGIEIRLYPSTHLENDTYVFNYLRTKGKDTKASIGTINKIEGVFYNSAGEEVELICTNIDPLTNGSSYESIESMKTNAPLSFTRNERLVTKNDYQSAITEIFKIPLGDDVKIFIQTEDDIKEVKWNELENYNFTNHCRIFVTGFYKENTKDRKYPYDKNDANGDGKVGNSNIPLKGKFALDSNYEVLKQLTNKKSLTDYFILKDTVVHKYYLQGVAFYTISSISESTLIENINDHLSRNNASEDSDYGKNIYGSDKKINLYGVNGVNHYTVFPWVYMEYDSVSYPLFNPDNIIHTKYDLFNYAMRFSKNAWKLVNFYELVRPIYDTFIKIENPSTTQKEQFIDDMQNEGIKGYCDILFKTQEDVESIEESTNMNYAIPSDNTDRLFNLFGDMRNAILTLTGNALLPQEGSSSGIKLYNALELFMNVARLMNSILNPIEFKEIFGESYDSLIGKCSDMASDPNVPEKGMLGKFNQFIPNIDDKGVFKDIYYDNEWLFEQGRWNNPKSAPSDSERHNIPDIVWMLIDKRTYGEEVGYTESSTYTYSGTMEELIGTNKIDDTDLQNTMKIYVGDTELNVGTIHIDSDQKIIHLENTTDIEDTPDVWSGVVYESNSNTGIKGRWQLKFKNLYPDNKVIRFQYAKNLDSWDITMFKNKIDISYMGRETFPSDEGAKLNALRYFFTDFTDDHTLPESIATTQIQYDDGSENTNYQLDLNAVFREGDYYVSTVNSDGELVEDLFYFRYHPEWITENKWEFHICSDISVGQIRFNSSSIPKTAVPINPITTDIKFSGDAYTVDFNRKECGAIDVLDRNVLLKMYSLNSKGEVTSNPMRLIVRCIPANNDIISTSGYQIWQWSDADNKYPFCNPWNNDQNKTHSEYFREVMKYRGIALKNE